LEPLRKTVRGVKIGVGHLSGILFYGNLSPVTPLVLIAPQLVEKLPRRHCR
jgi:hypothetical protein